MMSGLVACGQPVGSAETGEAVTTSGTSLTEGASAGSTGDLVDSTRGTTDAGGTQTDTGAPVEPLEFEVVVQFDPARGELPEGLALHDGDVYVGLAPAGRVVRVDGAGAISEYGTWPALDPAGGFLSGIVFNPAGDLFAGVTSSAPGGAPGVYVLRAGEQDAVLYGAHPQMVFPNDLKFDEGGRLYVSDSLAGQIFTVEPDGATEPWAADDLLVGDTTACPPDLVGFPVGINGIALRDGFVYGVNSNSGTIVRIEIQPDGSAGPVDPWLGPDCDLVGMDGFAIDEDGSLLIAVNLQDRVFRVSPEGTVQTLAEGEIFDGPASLEIAEGEEPRGIYVTNFGLVTAGQGGEPAVALLRALYP